MDIRVIRSGRVREKGEERERQRDIQREREREQGETNTEGEGGRQDLRQSTAENNQTWTKDRIIFSCSL